MSSIGLADAIREVCCQMIEARDQPEQELLAAELRALLHEHAHRAHDRASEAIAQILELEEHAKKLS